MRLRLCILLLLSCVISVKAGVRNRGEWYDSCPSDTGKLEVECATIL